MSRTRLEHSNKGWLQEVAPRYEKRGVGCGYMGCKITYEGEITRLRLDYLLLCVRGVGILWRKRCAGMLFGTRLRMREWYFL